MKKIQFEFFEKKSLKNHNKKNICPRDFCLAPNEREFSKLLTLSISLEAPIARSRCPTSPWENKNHVSLEYVKKSKTDFDFFPDKISVFEFFYFWVISSFLGILTLFLNLLDIFKIVLASLKYQLLLVLYVSVKKKSKIFHFILFFYEK